MQPQTYTWKQFVDAVRVLCPVDANRIGVGATDYFTGLIRQAVIHLQACMDELRIGHETIYEPSDFVQEGSALRGVKPPQSVIRDVFFVKFIDSTVDGYDADKPCIRYNCRTNFDWSQRFNLVNAYEPVDGRAIFCLDPAGYIFYLYPAPPDGECWKLSMNWDGLKLDFKDDEQTPFNEMMAGLVADWVKANTKQDVEDDGENHDRHMRRFNSAKPLLKVTLKEMAAVRN